MINVQTRKQDWETEFGSSYFDKIGQPVVDALNMLEDVSYNNDELPSFVLCDKQFGEDKYSLRAWAGFDDLDVDRKIFVFSLGLNVNDEYDWNYGSRVEAIFGNINPTCNIGSDEMLTNDQNIIELIMQSKDNFPEVITNFIESEIL